TTALVTSPRRAPAKSRPRSDDRPAAASPAGRARISTCTAIPAPPSVAPPLPGGRIETPARRREIPGTKICARAPRATSEADARAAHRIGAAPDGRLTKRDTPQKTATWAARCTRPRTASPRFVAGSTAAAAQSRKARAIQRAGDLVPGVPSSNRKEVMAMAPSRSAVTMIRISLGKANGSAREPLCTRGMRKTAADTSQVVSRSARLGDVRVCMKVGPERGYAAHAKKKPDGSTQIVRPQRAAVRRLRRLTLVRPGGYDG